MIEVQGREHTLMYFIQGLSSCEASMAYTPCNDYAKLKKIHGENYVTVTKIGDQMFAFLIHFRGGS